MVSTGYVYGSTDPSRPAEETDALCERGKFGLYADSKAEMERICREYADKAIIVRPFTHTGPGQASNFAVSSFARQIAEIEKRLREPVVCVGNLEALRDMLHVKDVVRAYVSRSRWILRDFVRPISPAHQVRMRVCMLCLAGCHSLTCSRR